MSRFTAMLIVLGGCLSAGIAGRSAWAEDPKPAAAPPAVESRNLSATEQQLYRDYERFEKSLFDVAEQLRRKDADRAELLYRARNQSQEQNILSEMQTIAELLRSQDASGAATNPQYGPAADRQKEVLVRMKTVLKLLQSQDERERVAAEIARIQDLLKDTNRLIARQKDVRADTQRSQKPGSTKDAQERVADEARKLTEKIEQQDAERQANAAPSQSEPQPGEEKSGAPKENSSPDNQGQPGKQKKEANPQGKEPDTQKSGDNSQKNSDSDKPSSGEEPSDQKGQKSGGQKSQGQKSQGQKPQGQKSEGQKSQGQPTPGQEGQKPEKQQASPDSQKTAGREQLEQARREMQQAIEKLEQEQQEQAIEKQDDAVHRLEELKAQLEEILRQLREDERESYLTMLEARFQNMLRRQQHVNSETVRLDRIESSARSQQNYASQTDTIRKEQEDNALEAEKALHLLKEEGSSVAFPEAVEQMHKNMQLVASRLARQDSGQTTQIVEKMVIDTLEEMIAALRQELQKKQEEKQQGPQSGQGQPQDPALVNQLAELKLIRSLQNQINVLTKQIGTEVESGGAGSADQVQLIQDLRVRQKRIQDATYDLSVGRNQ